MYNKKKINSVLRDTQVDGSMSVTRSSSGKIWVCQWDKYSGKRGQHVVFRELSQSDIDEMKSTGVDFSNDAEIISWAVSKGPSK